MAETDTQTKPQKPASKEKVILCLNQNGQEFQQLCGMVSDWGMNVVQADNSRVALARAREKKPVIVLVDLAEGEADANDFLSRKAYDPVLKDLPFLVMIQADQATKANISSWIKHGVLGVLIKPFERDDFLDRAEAILQGGSQEAPEEGPEPEQPPGPVLSFEQRMARSGAKPMGLDFVARKVMEVSTLPQFALKVMELARRPDTTVKDMEEVIRADPALTTKVLRTVNSAAYALVERLTTLEQAISYLGNRQVRNLAMTASVSKMFAGGDRIGPYQRKNLWRHMVSVALCARMVARELLIGNYEDAFLAGLLHDIGIILEDQYDHQNFVKMVNAMRDGDMQSSAEKFCLGYDHNMLGGRLAETWRFPEVVRGAIRYHHAAQNYRGEDPEIASCVEVANFICASRGISSLGLRGTSPDVEVFKMLKIDKASLLHLIGTLEIEFAKHRSLFELTEQE